jgi:uncharacterized repeat protein (TIGR03847 family)
VEQFLAQISQQNPNLETAAGEFSEERMRIHPPVDPLFRVGDIGLGYDKIRDRIIIFVKEQLTEEDDPESAAHIRFWATRSQMHKLARWGIDVLGRGRPICPQCSQPMDAAGHFCPKKNGHRH